MRKNKEKSVKRSFPQWHWVTLKPNGFGTRRNPHHKLQGSNVLQVFKWRQSEQQNLTTGCPQPHTRLDCSCNPSKRSPLFIIYFMRWNVLAQTALVNVLCVICQEEARVHTVNNTVPCHCKFTEEQNTEPIASTHYSDLTLKFSNFIGKLVRWFWFNLMLTLHRKWGGVRKQFQSKNSIKKMKHNLSLTSNNVVFS